MKHPRFQILVAAAVLGAAVMAGWAATNVFQSTVPIVPGVQGCTRLDGNMRQTACLSAEFSKGAELAARSASGADRDERVIRYVRRAEDLAAGDPQLAGLCHPAMHQLGRHEGTLAARESRVPGFPEGASQLCTAGYVHGLAEGYLVGSDSADTAAVFPKLCHDADARSGCAHGIGHALFRARAKDALAAASGAALDACDALPKDYPTNCHDGVYMEIAMRTDPATVPVAEFVRTCSQTREVDRQLACWGYLGLSTTTNDVSLEQVPQWCARASLPGQYVCLEGYGRNLGVDRVASCGTASKERGLQERCVEGAMGLQVGSGHVTAAAARTACRAIETDSLESHCRDAVKRYARGRASVEGSAPTT